MAKLIVSILAHFVNCYQHIHSIYCLIFLFKLLHWHRYKPFLVVLRATCSGLMGRLGNEN